MAAVMEDFSRYETPHPVQPALIGPNAILQLDPLLRAAGLDRAVYEAADLDVLPDGESMIDEAPVARVHQALRRLAPDMAEGLSYEAGVMTGRYILTHRIPQTAQSMLLSLPWRLSARLLARAIAANAWTFAGSGEFRVLSPFSFELRDNPIVRGERADHAICHWHCGVFTTLYAALVHPKMRCVETECGATGYPACRFELVRDA